MCYALYVIFCTEADNRPEFVDDEVIIACLKKFAAFVFLSQLKNFKYFT